MKNEPRSGRVGGQNSFQVPLIAMLHAFAKDSVGVRFAVLLCGVFAEIVLRVQNCIVRLAIAGFFIAVTAGKIQLSFSVISSWLWRQL